MSENTNIKYLRKFRPAIDTTDSEPIPDTPSLREARERLLAYMAYIRDPAGFQPGNSGSWGYDEDEAIVDAALRAALDPEAEAER